MHKESYIFIETRSSKGITDTEKSETPPTEIFLVFGKGSPENAIILDQK